MRPIALVVVASSCASALQMASLSRRVEALWLRPL